MADTPFLHADSIFRALGPTGRYQILMFTIASLAVFPAYFQLLDTVFIASSVDHQCARPEANTTDGDVWSAQLTRDTLSSDLNLTYGQCYIRLVESGGKVVADQPCIHGHQYEGPKSQSVVSQLDLVCDKEYLIRVSQTLVFAGQGFGALVGPFFSDRFGRKPAMAAAGFFMLLVGMTIAMAPNIIVFALAKFVIGAMQQSLYIPLCIYKMEIFPTDYRRYGIIISTISWSLSGMTMTFVAYLMQDQSWRLLQAVLSLSSLVFILQLGAMDESIVWLLANGKREAALKCIRRAARLNGKNARNVIEAGYSSEWPMSVSEKLQSEAVDSSDSDDKTSVPMLLQETGEARAEAGGDGAPPHTVADDNEDALKTPSPTPTAAGAERLSFIHILRVRQLRKYAIVMWFTWITASLSYFTLYLMVSTLAGDVYINYLLTSFMDIPACFIFYFGLNKIGRRSVTILLYAVLAIGTFALGLIRHFTDSEHGAWSVITLITSLISIVGGSGCFFSIFFYLPELFPTNVRNQATGTASMFARMGAMLSPFMGSLSDVAIWLPGLVMAALSFIAVLLLLLLPETKDKQLPQTVEEIEAWHPQTRNPKRGNDQQEKTAL